MGADGWVFRRDTNHLVSERSWTLCGRLGTPELVAIPQNQMVSAHTLCVSACVRAYMRVCVCVRVSLCVRCLCVCVCVGGGGSVSVRGGGGGEGNWLAVSGCLYICVFLSICLSACLPVYGLSATTECCTASVRVRHCVPIVQSIVKWISRLPLTNGYSNGRLWADTIWF